MIAQITPARLEKHLERLVGIRHHAVAPEALEAAADYISEQFREAGLKVRAHRFEAFGHRNRNIIASQGSRRGNPAFILAAHYDTVSESPGADDNASGVAVVLEAARLLGKLRTRVPLRFIGFAQEEQHCLGSTLYAIRLRRAGARIRGMISLECVGYASDRPGSQQPLRGLPVRTPETGNFLGVVGNPESVPLLEQFGKTAGRYVPDLPIVPLIVPNGGHAFPDTRRSDHAPFWDAGYPALMITDTADYRYPGYHLPGDTLDKLSLPFLARVAQAVVAYLYYYSMLADG